VRIMYRVEWYVVNKYTFDANVRITSFSCFLVFIVVIFLFFWKDAFLFTVGTVEDKP